MSLEGLLAGRLLGDRYRIEEVIGRGGMGVVYRATDERLGREVAVKVITLVGGNEPEGRERLRARFDREARSAAALPHHPNVVPVYDYGTDSTLGLDFLVMELLRGDDLASRLSRSGPPPLASSLRILQEAARGLAVGHRSGLIHRDVKPGNIFIADSEHGEAQVRVLDFGIAKLAADEDTASQLTQDGRAPHSPAFASPEQLRGLTRLTPASDVFSLGAVGYVLLTGQRPFSETDRNRMSLGMPVAPPALRAINPAIPSSVEGIIRKALSFEPAERFPDAAAMAKAIDRALRQLADQPVEPYPAVPIPGVGGIDDDRTAFLEDEDDHTLLDTSAPIAAPPASPQPRPPLAPPPPEKKGGWGKRIAWTTFILLLLAAGAYAVMVMEDGGGMADGEDIPPPPADVTVTTPEVEVPETEEPQPALDALINNQEGLRYYREGDYSTALDEFREAVDAAPDNSEYRYNYATTLLQLGRAEEAADELETVIAREPGNPRGYFQMGVARLQLGDTTAAIASLQRVLGLSTDPRQRATTERRLREIEAALATPEPTPLPVPAPADSASFRFPVPRQPLDTGPGGRRDTARIRFPPPTDTVAFPDTFRLRTG
ncbi:MAG TPA: tetratricopeptide repeat protein [Longimicrobiaceae bacterium]|nr:tetratricopeptide repeat protein [Longimicrobiaceae bacterium]